MSFSHSMLEELKVRVRASLSVRRFEHTLGVERAAVHLGNCIMPHKLSELRAAAVLHDIAKEMTRAELIARATEFDPSVDVSRVSDNVLHSLAAPSVVREQFSDFATADVLDAVYHHTLGAEDMSLFTEIIFVSDYIEDSREYYSCREALDHISGAMFCAESMEERVVALHRTAVMVIDNTIESLKRRNIKPMRETLLTKKSLLTKI